MQPSLGLRVTPNDCATLGAPVVGFNHRFERDSRGADEAILGKARVMNGVKDTLDLRPEMYRAKYSAVFEHVYESYSEQSVEVSGAVA
jgi:hypothetical protein